MTTVYNLNKLKYIQCKSRIIELQRRRNGLKTNEFRSFELDRSFIQIEINVIYAYTL